MSVHKKTAGFFPVPAHQAIANLAQAAAVQNTWYTVLSTTKNVRLYYLCVRMDTLAEDVEERLTIDGQTYVGSQAAAVAGTNYFCFLQPDGAGNMFLTEDSNRVNVMYTSFLEGRSVKYEVRKTSANGANTLRGTAIYGKW